MQISRRLEAVAALVSSGGAVADVGTDHAYIPIYLVRTGRAPHAVAMDVNAGPLARAREHIAQYGLEASVETRLSDGLEALRPGEAQSIVIAGMGGPLTVRILDAGREKLAGCGELILQPQSEIRTVRLWLMQNGWEIAREDMVCEEGKFYPMMRAVPAEEQPAQEPDGLMPAGDLDTVPVEAQPMHGPEELSAGGRERVTARPLTEPELRFGPLLLRERHPVLREYLERERGLKMRILEALRGQSGEAALRRAQEVREALALAEDALALMRAG